MKIIKNLILLTSCILTTTTLHVQATEKIIGLDVINHFGEMSKNEVEMRIYALLWLLCAEDKEIKNLALINKFQTDYAEIKKEVLKKYLYTIISNYPEIAQQVMKETIESTCLNNKAVLKKNSDNSIICKTHCLYLSDILEVFLEAGLDPLIPINLNVLKKFPTEKNINDMSSAYWENIDSIPTEEIIKEHVQFFESHRTKAIKALHDSLNLVLINAINKCDKKTVKQAVLCAEALQFTNEEYIKFLGIASDTQNLAIINLLNNLPPKNISTIPNKQEEVEEEESYEIEEDSTNNDEFNDEIIDKDELINNKKESPNSVKTSIHDVFLRSQRHVIMHQLGKSWVQALKENKEIKEKLKTLTDLLNNEYFKKDELDHSGPSRVGSFTPLTSLFMEGVTLSDDEMIEIIDLLVTTYKADIDRKDASGKTVLQRAIQNKRQNVVNHLIKANALVSQTDDIYLAGNNNIFLSSILYQSGSKTLTKPKIQPYHWYKNPWIWTGIACGAGLAAWGVYTYLHKKPFIPALFTRYILNIKQRVMSQFSTARTHSRRPDGLLRVSGL